MSAGLSRTLSRALLAVAIAALGWGAAPAAAQDAAHPARFAGQYKIDDWKSLEGRGMHHLFNLRANGRFLLGGEWPDHESSRFSGTWALSGDRIVLQGQGEVWTNQGRWRTPFLRSYTIDETEGTIRLTPVPEKNRYGMLGWPNAFLRERDGGGRDGKTR